MMGTRILSGELRGWPIGPIPKTMFARPILARIRKSLFDIVRPKIENAHFLDLFSGSGTVGIEALSQGAQRVVFLDVNPQCTRWIQKAIDQIKYKNETFVNKKDIEIRRDNALSGLSS